MHTDPFCYIVYNRDNTLEDHLRLIISQDSELLSMETNRSARLTERQLQVVGCLAAGLTDGEIGSCLAISPRTVRMHCDAIRARLVVARRRQIPIAYRQQSGRDPLELYELLLAENGWRSMER